MIPTKKSPEGLQVNHKDTKRKRIKKYELVYKWRYPIITTHWGERSLNER